jgi:hypothetical protein
MAGNKRIREIYENPLLLPGYGVILNNSYIKKSAEE